MSEQKVNFKDFLNIYDFDYVLPGSGKKVVYKPITTGQLKRLLTYERETDPVVIDGALDELITSAVISEDFDIKEIYLQDRFSLLVELRKATKGTAYEFTHECSKCRSQNLQIVDLNKLETIKLPKKINPAVELTNEIYVKLDNIKRGDQIAAWRTKMDKRFNDTQKIVELSMLTHAAGIKAVGTPDGEQTDLTINDKKYLLENISTTAYDKIKDWYTKYDFGIDFTFPLNCKCGNKNKVTIPMQNFFF